MDLDFSAVLPDDPSRYGGSQFIRIALALLLFVMVARSCVHLFASDGGAQRIGGVDTSDFGVLDVTFKKSFWSSPVDDLRPLVGVFSHPVDSRWVFPI